MRFCKAVLISGLIMCLTGSWSQAFEKALDLKIARGTERSELRLKYGHPDEVIREKGILSDVWLLNRARYKPEDPAGDAMSGVTFGLTRVLFHPDKLTNDHEEKIRLRVYYDEEGRVTEVIRNEVTTQPLPPEEKPFGGFDALLPMSRLWAGEDS